MLGLEFFKVRERIKQDANKETTKRVIHGNPSAGRKFMWTKAHTFIIASQKRTQDEMSKRIPLEFHSPRHMKKLRYRAHSPRSGEIVYRAHSQKVWGS